MQKKFLFFAFIFLIFSPPVFALTLPPQELLKVSRMRKMVGITVSGIVTPKVVIFETPEIITMPVMLFDEEGKMLPARVERSAVFSRTVQGEVVDVSSQLEGEPRALVDNFPATRFAFNPDQQGVKQIIVRFNEQTIVSGIETNLDLDVIRPTVVTLRAKISGAAEFITILDRVTYGTVVTFPKIRTQEMEIAYESRHLLRITDIEFLGEPKTTTASRVIFFGEEGKRYVLYWDAHFGQETYAPAIAQPLATDLKTPVFPLPPSAFNPVFNPDWDADGIRDETDLCPKEYDPANADSDKNGRGDVCEDPDQDGFVSSKDNCPFKYNPAQEDADQDGIGDLCDTEENRLTEIYDDIVLWGAFGAAALLLAFLVVRAMRRKEQ